MFIIEKGGERQHVNALEPYSIGASGGWTLIGEDAALDAEDVPELCSYEAGAWRVDDERKADRDAGTAAIAKAHAIKQVEAALFLSGVTLTAGLIVEEAAALDLEVLALATAIHAEAAVDRTAEIERRQRKVAHRAAYGPGPG